MQNFLSAISENTAIIDIIIRSIFYLVTAGVAIVTYRTARKNLLGPMKSEVVKKQTDLFLGLLSFLKDLQQTEEDLYREIMYININIVFIHAGLLDKERAKEVGSKIDLLKGSTGIMFPTIEVNGEKRFDFKVVTEIYRSKNDIDEDANVGSTGHSIGLKKEVEEGKYRLSNIYFSKNYETYMDKLRDYIANPLLPTQIVSLLRVIEETISDNVFDVARDTVKEVVNGAHEHGSCNINMGGVVRLFHKKAKRLDGLCYGATKYWVDENKDIYGLVRKKIRDYLHVDDEWQ